MHVARLVGDGEAGVARRHARSHGPGAPAAHAVGAAGIEQFLKRKGQGVPVCEASTRQGPHRKGVLVLVSHPQGLDRLCLTADILGIRNAENRLVPVLAARWIQDAADQGGHVASHIKLEAGIEIGFFGVDRRVGRVIEHAAAAQVDVAAEGVLQVRVPDILIERRIDARGFHGAQLDGKDLEI